MKLSVAFVAAVIAASTVRAEASSEFHLIATRSDFKLNGDATFQAVKRGTDTELLTRRVDPEGEPRHVIYARDTIKPENGFLVKRGWPTVVDMWDSTKLYFLENKKKNLDDRLLEMRAKHGKDGVDLRDEIFEMANEQLRLETEILDLNAKLSQRKDKKRRRPTQI